VKLSKNLYREKVLHAVEQAKEPIDAENIRVLVGIGNWQTSLKHLLQLKIEDKINGQKTSRGWIFWPKNVKEIAANE